MSFVHATLVGHFDPRTVLVQKKPVILKPLEMALVQRLLAEFGEGVARCIWIENGYAHCQWAPAAGAMGRVIEFAERLARESGAVMVNWNHMLVTHPPEAVRAQEEALAALQAQDAEPGAAPESAT